MNSNSSSEVGKLNICVMTHPFRKDGQFAISSLRDFVNTIEPLSNEMYVITGFFSGELGEKSQVIKVKRDAKNEPILVKAANSLSLAPHELRISLHFLKLARKIDIVIFFLMPEYWLPTFIAKLLRKRTIVVATGSPSKHIAVSYKRPFLRHIVPRLYHWMEKLNYRLADHIGARSETVLPFLGGNRYKNKVFLNAATPLDTTLFSIKKPYEVRENLVGYIGRLASGKGAGNFAEAIPLISRKEEGLRFLIGGDGPMSDGIRAGVEEKGLSDKVSFTGWIPRETLPHYLNELKLFVLPSYSEGFPLTLLQAMACGTPVLVTPVGGIPDIIKDGETGFILEDNSPQCIARNVLRALEHPRLDEIIRNARRLVEERYNFETVREQYRKMLYGAI